MKHLIPEGDVLIHAGDCSNVGYETEIKDFIEWFKTFKSFKYKIFIAGNHDFAFEKKTDDFKYYLKKELHENDIIYLEDDVTYLNFNDFSRPLKVYGSPWQPRFNDWAFNINRYADELKEKWDLIPINTDILITHTPPYNVRDFVSNYNNIESVGCHYLRDRIEIVEPLLHVFGHIHNGYGATLIKNTMFINAATCNERYEPTNKPIILDIVEENKNFEIYLQDE